eukprot:7199810-Pyramimonas_sp.AAC.1
MCIRDSNCNFSLLASNFLRRNFRLFVCLVFAVLSCCCCLCVSLRGGPIKRVRLTSVAISLRLSSAEARCWAGVAIAGARHADSVPLGICPVLE